MTDILAVANGAAAGTFPQGGGITGTPLSGHTYSYVNLVAKQFNYDSNGSEVLFNSYHVYIDEGDAAYAQWVLNYNKEIANLSANGAGANKILAATAINATISAATNATTLATVNNALWGGLITSTSAAAVTITLPTTAQLVTYLATLGITVAAGYSFSFVVDNTAGANTVTLAVAAGTTAAKQVSSGDTAVDALLTIAATAGGGVGYFTMYFTSATVSTLFRDK